MQLPINKDGNIELDLFDIVSEVVHRATPEEREAMVENFGILKPIRDFIIDKLANEYSRPSFYEGWHDDRLKFLKAIKQEELDYYASLIADKLSDEERHQKAYWELYWWCQKNNITNMAGFPHQALKCSDWKWKQELEDTVRQIIKTERPSLLEVNQ